MKLAISSLSYILLIFSVCLTSTMYGQKGKWVDIFDGKTLKGWSIHSGTAKYAVVDGEIVGTTVPKSPNTFLCSDKEYADFILEFEVFLVHPELNSGVQFRSIVPKKETIYWFRDGKGEPAKKVIPTDRLYGYQVEIATEENGTSGGIYDEGRRGFFIGNSTSEGTPASRAFKDGQWNTYKIQCQGQAIKTWINDVPCADFMDAMTAKGVIGLQVHGVGEKTNPMQVKWRNIRIKEL